ncbi:cytochrome P450 [Sordaria brevicollis]|uniref:Cytochrome P450 n=1 Tax=Sordaria brevicollis TaxID=83679 RepID=A0AAE0PKS1_SORBR|nr:cytochrome P450 [Sordaria brevicollis]
MAANTVNMDLNNESTIATDSLLNSSTPLSLKAILSPSSVLNLFLIWLGYRILLALYNISPFHPLYKFPGPKIAAATFIYEAWYDWILQGQYTNKIKEMHKKYGPIIRISPHEIHISTPSFADDLYPSSSSSRIRDKSQHQLNTGGAGPVSVTGFSTVSHEIHRMKRAPLSKFFSRSQMLLLESEVTDHARRVISKLLRIGGGKNGETQDVKEAFNCFTADVIAQYAFGESLGFVDQEGGWEPNFATWTSSFFRAAYGMRHNSLMRKSASALPFLAKMNLMGEDVKRVLDVMTVLVPEFIQKALGSESKGGRGGVFAEIIRGMSEGGNGKRELTEEEMYWLSGEGFNFLLAGTETTAAILTTITFWLLAKPEVYERLMQDLGGLKPETIKWTELEQRPYMWAVVHEALRMMPGVSHRSSRVARTEDLVFRDKKTGKEYVIPRGTPVGMTSMIQHWDEELFPQPDEFLPERWLLEDGKPDYKLQKMLLAFGKSGHGRACIGESLAYCEVYIMAALMAFHVIPRAKLVDTTRENFDYHHDMIVPQTKFGSISCKVAIQ